MPQPVPETPQKVQDLLQYHPQLQKLTLRTQVSRRVCTLRTKPTYQVQRHPRNAVLRAPGRDEPRNVHPDREELPDEEVQAARGQEKDPT